ncbi:hypothetical protein [Granulicella aggregans]|uniref:hypothetical protein n=1 Tax=Granulicella aggregans TaxID=474949 RepID=UPI0021DF4B89|nr:hypothetical protein [Granulicella aggregans]
MTRRIKTASIAGYLAMLSFVSFLPLFLWKSKELLLIAASFTWLTMTYVGVMALFGSKETSMAIMWQGRSQQSKFEREVGARVLGAVLLIFMLFVTHEVLQGGVRAAYNNFGR